MKDFQKTSFLFFCAFLLPVALAGTSAAQDRARMVVRTVSSVPVNPPPAALPASTEKTKTLTSSTPINTPPARATLTNQITVTPPAEQPLVKKTASSAPVNAAALAGRRLAYNPAASAGMMRGIESRLGIPYRYGSTGPNRYDCSGFVWAVFNDAGMNFERMSARGLWTMGEPVEGDDRYKFGTLVFFNGLGHVGIVADENGFYHASSSKGITYSKFEGYWEKRVVGFRRLPMTPETLPVLKEVGEQQAEKGGK